MVSLLLTSTSVFGDAHDAPNTSQKSTEPVGQSTPTPTSAVELAESITVTEAMPASIKAPTTRAELQSEYQNEILHITNERLRREVEMLARDYRDAESRNVVYMLAFGGLIALVFLVIGFVAGRRTSTRHTL